MTVTAVVGAQWGDEGKGKIVDVLAQDADLVCRFGGGSNAGHTIVNNFGSFKLHSLPSGAFNPSATNLIGTGTAVDFDSLGSELDEIHRAGAPEPTLVISNRAHVIMPFHKRLDRLRDEALGVHKIGTTGQGIGPAYVDKVDRMGIQAGELLDMNAFRAKVSFVLEAKNNILSSMYGSPTFALEEILSIVDGWRNRFVSIIGDTIPVLTAAVQNDDRILLEGQLGIMRDLDWGTYPFVTSSTTFAAGAGSGAGIAPRMIGDVVAVVKAYTSAVGTGPLPTELTGPEADSLRERGDEYGATTGRPRRVGWLDGVALKYASAVGGFTRLAVTKLDVLDGIDPLRIAVAYWLDGRELDHFPLTADLSRVEVLYEELPGWTQPTADAVSREDLPINARNYLDRLAMLAGAPVSMIGVGQSRDQTIMIPGPEVAPLPV